MPIYRVLIAMKSRQTVSQYAPEAHQKKQGTPTMGGLIVAIGFLIGSLGFVLASSSSTQGTNSLRSLGIIGLFVGFTVIGFIDDFVVPRLSKKRGLEWKEKIVMQFAVAGGCAWIMCGEFSATMLAVVFFILFFSNAYNFSDGLDALAALLLIGLGGGLLFIAHARDAVNLEPILAALLGASLPFLYLNKPKAKIFMGDVGSLPIGAVLGLAVSALAFPNDFDFLYARPVIATLGLQPAYYRPQPEWLLYVALFAISGMMIVELVPVPLQILSVKLRKKRLFSFTPIHHAFERKGWPERKVVGVFCGCQLALTLIAIAVISASHTPSIVIRTLENKDQPGVRWHIEPTLDANVPAMGGNHL